MKDFDGLAIQERIMQLDPKLLPEDPGFLAACVLLSSAVVGPNADKIAHFLGERRLDVRIIGRRLREQGVWNRNRVMCDWLDKDTGVCAFWLDVCVARGWMNRTEEVR